MIPFASFCSKLILYSEIRSAALMTRLIAEVTIEGFGDLSNPWVLPIDISDYCQGDLTRNAGAFHRLLREQICRALAHCNFDLQWKDKFGVWLPCHTDEQFYAMVAQSLQNPWGVTHYLTLRAQPFGYIPLAERRPPPPAFLAPQIPRYPADPMPREPVYSNFGDRFLPSSPRPPAPNFAERFNPLTSRTRLPPPRQPFSPVPQHGLPPAGPSGFPPPGPSPPRRLPFPSPRPAVPLKKKEAQKQPEVSSYPARIERAVRHFNHHLGSTFHEINVFVRDNFKVNPHESKATLEVALHKLVFDGAVLKNVRANPPRFRLPEGITLSRKSVQKIRKEKDDRIMKEQAESGTRSQFSVELIEDLYPKMQELHKNGFVWENLMDRVMVLYSGEATRNVTYQQLTKIVLDHVAKGVKDGLLSQHEATYRYIGASPAKAGKPAGISHPSGHLSRAAMRQLGYLTRKMRKAQSYETDPSSSSDPSSDAVEPNEWELLDLNWMIVNAVRALNDPGGVTIVRLRDHLDTVHGFGRYETASGRNLLQSAVDKAVNKKILQRAGPVKERPLRYKLNLFVKPADYLEPSAVEPRPLRKRKFEGADETAPSSSKDQKVSEAGGEASVTEFPVKSEGEVQIAHQIKPVEAAEVVADGETDREAGDPKGDSLTRAQRRVRRMAVSNAVKLLSGTAGCTVDTAFGFVVAQSADKSDLPVWTMGDVRAMLLSGVEAGIYSRSGRRYRFAEKGEDNMDTLAGNSVAKDVEDDGDERADEEDVEMTGEVGAKPASDSLTFSDTNSASNSGLPSDMLLQNGNAQVGDTAAVISSSSQPSDTQASVPRGVADGSKMSESAETVIRETMPTTDLETSATVNGSGEQNNGHSNVLDSAASLDGEQQGDRGVVQAEVNFPDGKTSDDGHVKLLATSTEQTDALPAGEGEGLLGSS